jgi:hypothetical protein
MSKKNLADLRETLFDALDQVKSGTMDLARAKVVANLGQVIINTASAQVRAMNAIGRDKVQDDGFFGPEPPIKRLHGAPSVEPPTRAVDPLRKASPEPANGRAH